MSVNQAKVQIVRSGKQTPRSRPNSLISLEEPSASAVSGRTLARALIANSFVLSSDKRMSRYRSGASNLTRTDSATLPRGEHPFLYSPYPRERTLSAYSDYSPNSRRASIIPPVPPVPSPLPPIPNPELYSPPVTGSRMVVPETRNAKASSFGAVLADGDVDAESAPQEDPQPISTDFRPTRISRISEANSSDPSINRKDGSAGASNQSLVPTSPLSLEPPARPTSTETRPESQIVSPASVSSTAPSSALDLEGVLDYYRQDSSPGFVPPPPPPPPPPENFTNGFRPIFSPISEESSSQLSPPTPYRHDSPRQPVKVVLGSSSSSGMWHESSGFVLLKSCFSRSNRLCPKSFANRHEPSPNRRAAPFITGTSKSFPSPDSTLTHDLAFITFETWFIDHIIR